MSLGGPTRAIRRGALACTAALLLSSAALAAAASAVLFHNPLRDSGTGGALSCPDPSVTDALRSHFRYFMVCTSDLARDALPIWKSNDLVHWRRSGFVFPRASHPWWALAPGRAGGKFWAPEIYRFGGRWVIYFAASYDRSKLDLRLADGSHVAPRTHVVGVATADTIGGPWHTRLLHYRGQYNAVNREQERYGGAIDPSAVQDPRTKQLYLFWADQSSEIWAGELSADGLRLQPHIHRVLEQDEAWECDQQNKACTIEGPEPFYRAGILYLMFSGANTWDASYSVGVASSTDAMDPSHPFAELAGPILRQGHGFIGPGHASRPIIGPDGGTYVLYHAARRPSPTHASANRLLMVGRLNWIAGWPRINDGLAG
jgi:arabinan endo-1,5-alpha-L-arabinosidase